MKLHAKKPAFNIKFIRETKEHHQSNIHQGFRDLNQAPLLNSLSSSFKIVLIYIIYKRSNSCTQLNFQTSGGQGHILSPKCGNCFSCSTSAHAGSQTDRSILFIKGQTTNRPTNMYLHAFLLSVEWIIKNNETFISKQEYSDPYKSSTHCRRDAHRLLEFMF